MKGFIEVTNASTGKPFLLNISMIESVRALEKDNPDDPDTVEITVPLLIVSKRPKVTYYNITGTYIDIVRKIEGASV